MGTSGLRLLDFGLRLKTKPRNTRKTRKGFNTEARIPQPKAVREVNALAGMSGRENLKGIEAGTSLVIE